MDPIYREALAAFESVVDRAQNTSLIEPLAMTLATTDEVGSVSARVVLLRGFDERGFVFYTNLDSRKGRKFNETKTAALCLHWDELKEQVRVEGRAELVEEQEADAYWKDRPRGCQIGAWASQQSADLESRQMLEKRADEIEQRFAGQDVPRPDFWSGFRVVPHRIEFWKGMPSRLHKRTLFERLDSDWMKRLLYP